ncbi:hypothetical protein PM3016_7313 [Paenibacillus mucilaginosus 3016]|uniref:Uncharacterized protein n=3 Tax=Paenibacillus mucilaginosus TaxID=61624 RepID=H6NEB1_9BACL|nr:hypothetical protein KNP414_07794 [Paenibacillus mucilaginosus KNP414]AFC33887.1 hypothetical protein PM3016_7313 [Paenibacillus mucilaginosus 3016]AFH66216.1 hypothetical protein B2K_36915 [Paenibacillus mucilaginosus K02]
MNKQPYTAPQIMEQQDITFETVPSHVCDGPAGDKNPHCD